MEIELLGPPRLRIGTEPVKVAGRQQALLAALALRARRSVSVSRLLEVVWGDEPLPGDPANALQQRISALRRLVDPQRAGEVLVASEVGYALHVPDERIDVRRFETLVARGRRRLAANDAAEAEATLSAALALWRGPALDGYAEEPWALAEATRLEELRAGAVEDRVDALLALGRHGELLADLRERVAAHPLRERTTAQLMTALYRTGRQADALAAYSRLRDRLVDELGVEPGPAVQTLQHRILLQDPDLEPARSEVVPVARGNVPAAVTPVLGREAAVAQVALLLGSARLVTLTGPGGAGKTTLALAAARCEEPPHGAWLVELGALTHGETIAATLARVLGIGGGMGGVADTDTLAAALAGRDALLVVDNCEHLRDDAAALVGRLLGAAPRLRVLATSRVPLGLPGEVVWSVPPLGVPAAEDTPEAVRRAPAVQLLLDRARGHPLDLGSDDAAAPLLGELARRLDGIPLALELAAARLRVLSLPELLDGLDDRFRILAGGAATAPSRQRTLRGALDWSWELLDTAQQRALAALAVPVSAFDLDDAALLLAAADVNRDTLEVVAELVDRSLLTVQRGDAPTRYRMLESVRDYARDRLDELGLSDAVRGAHAERVQQRLDDCHTATAFPDLRTLDRLLDDARAALRWSEQSGDVRRLQRIVARLGWLWLLRGLGGEGIGWLDRALGSPDAVEPAAAEPEALLWASALRASAGTIEHAGAWSALALTATAPGSGLHRLAEIFDAVHLANAQRFDDATRRLADVPGGGWVGAFASLVDAQIARIFGRFSDAGARAAAALDTLTGTELAWARMYVLAILADVAYAAGDYARAVVHARAALVLQPFPPVPEVEAGLHAQLALALVQLDDLDGAQQQVALGRERVATLPPVSATGYVELAVGVVAHRRGQLQKADAAFTAAVNLHERGVPVLGVVRAYAEVAAIRTELGDTAAAFAAAGRGLALATDMGDPHGVPLLLEALAIPVLADGRIDQALTLVASASAIRNAAGAAAPPHETRHGAAVTDRLAQALGVTEFTLRWAAASDHAAGDPEAAVQELRAAFATG